LRIKTGIYLVLIILGGNTLGIASETEDRVELVRSFIDSSNYHHDEENYIMAIRWASKASNHLSQINDASPVIKEQVHRALSQSLHAIGAKRDAVKHWHKLIFYRKKALEYYDLQCAFKYGSIGAIYLELDEKDSCFKAFREARKITRRLSEPLFYASSLNNLGMAYDAFGPKDSSLISYIRAIEILKKAGLGEHQLITAIYDNIAQSYESLDRMEEASFFYRKSIMVTNRSEEPKLPYQVRAYVNLVKNFHLANRTNGLEQLLDTAETVASKLPDSEQKYEALLAVLTIRIERGYGDKVVVLQQQNEVLLRLNATIAQQKAEAINGIGEYKKALLQQQNDINGLELARKESEIEQTKEAFTSRMYFLLIGTLTISLALVLIIIAHNRKVKQLKLQKKLSQLEIENERLKKVNLEEELESKKNDIVDLALDNSRTREFSKNVISKLKEAQESEDQDLSSFIKKMETEFHQQHSTEKRLTALQSNVDEVNQAFYNSIKDSFPNLTAGELELCGFIRLKLTGKEIANLRNVHPSSITKAKQRLRKKLELGPNADLYSFLQSF